MVCVEAAVAALSCTDLHSHPFSITQPARLAADAPAADHRSITHTSRSLTAQMGQKNSFVKGWVAPERQQTARSSAARDKAPSERHTIRILSLWAPHVSR
ncbi:hypothetical protein AOLI_G00176630 [Acnodon oligacanthus]